MQTFLGKLAEKAITDFSDSIDDLTIVLPSRRAIVFLREEFKKQLNSSSWLPKLISIEDFVKELGGYQQLDQIDLIFEFYKVYKSVEGKKAEPFSEFMNWAPALIQDFNEIDRYLVDANELYGFITEAKAIEIWNLDGQELSPFQSKYLHFWKKLNLYYSEFRLQLLSKNQVYQGLGFRSVAESIDKIDFSDYKNIIFAGFNALTSAEETIITFCRNEKSAKVLWDADKYYYDDQYQEAGFFLRRHQKLSNSQIEWISDDLLEGEKNIIVYEVPGNIAQAKLVGNILKKDSNKSRAVVLSDENLLLPILESLPSNVEDVNVTMGYPIILSTAYNLIEQYILLFKRSSHWKVCKQKSELKTSFYYKDIVKFFENISFQFISTEKKNAINDFVEVMKNDKIHFIKPEIFNKLEDKIEVSLFNLSKDYPKEIVINSLNLIKSLPIEESQSISQIEKECFYSLYKEINRLKTIIEEQEESLDIETLFQIFRQIVSKQNVDFVGEPLSGIQVMGVLESRTLDFEELIITSVNEGILPSGKTQNSFIPFDIKRKYKLPVYKEKDAIYSYHFYRLIQRAKKISILYNTKVDQLQGGEMSRFIKQLFNEVQSKNENIKLKRNTVYPKVEGKKNKEFFIENNKKNKEAIIKHIESGLSPSAINTYLNCPLNYYYKYILRLKEQEVIEDKIENATLGTIIHTSLEALYRPYLNQILTQKDITSMTSKVNSELEFQFIEELHIKPKYGNYRLNFEIARIFIQNLINSDKEQLLAGNEIHILQLEEEFQSTFEILNDGIKLNICLNGKVDRVDKINGKLRIIDYKSGGASPKDLSFSSINSLLSGKKNKAVQMLIYQLCYQNAKEFEKVESGIISLKNISNGFMPLNIEDPINQGLIFLSNLIDKMLTEEKFSHNSDSMFCSFCE